MTTLKLEVGKSYRTRDGRRVLLVNADAHDSYPFDSNEHSYTPNGFVYGPESPYYADLISEWQDEPTPATYTQADIQPLVDALEAINKMAWEDNEWDAVRKYEKCKELADKALERFKGMNTLAPSKTD